MNRIIGKGILPLLLVFMAGCNEGDERLKEIASLEGEESARKQVGVENENIRKWSSEMEQDLERRQRFFTALKGTFEGVLKSGNQEFRMRVKLFPSIPPYQSDRVRRIDEVTFDLVNLYFNIQVLYWDSTDNLASAGCRFENVRPDLENGQINLASENCPNFFSFNITDIPLNEETNVEEQDISGVLKSALDGDSRRLAGEILDAKTSRTNNIVGEMQGTINSAVYLFSLKRVTH